MLLVILLLLLLLLLLLIIPFVMIHQKLLYSWKNRPSQCGERNAEWAHSHAGESRQGIPVSEHSLLIPHHTDKELAGECHQARGPAEHVSLF